MNHETPRSKLEVEAPNILLIESFYGGSHKQLVDLLACEFPGCVKYCLPAKKWHWRMRTSALYFAQTIPCNHEFRVLFASSALNLAELVALRPDLAQLKKVYYFHENQLVYPVRKQQDRDFQYGYNQVLSCLVADVIAFNSKFNMESFLGSLSGFFKLMPDYRPTGLEKQIRPKCRIVYFPVQMCTCLSSDSSHEEQRKSSDKEEMQPSKTGKGIEKTGPLHIVWPHRWEHDKDAETFFHTLYKLVEEKFDFQVSVLGEQFSDVPSIFAEARERLAEYIVHWGYLPSKEEYVAVLCSADVVVSTAKHEFFGVAMLEAVQHGCYPVCPQKLVYPEFFPEEYLYSTPQQLAKKLRYFCKNPAFVQKHNLKVDLYKFSWASLEVTYKHLLSAPGSSEEENPYFVD